jgi:hypothetical protein
MSASAKVIKDSISSDGVRLTTMEIVMWRPALAEFNTHRAFSRNAASSRAVPMKKMIERIEKDPASPLVWGSNRSGMQAGPELEGDNLQVAKSIWLKAQKQMIENVRKLEKVGLHKQWSNRLIEPFMWITDIVSFTDIDNFFWQRCDLMALPDFKAVADAMQEAYYTSTPVRKGFGEWHLPYIIDADWNDIALAKPLTMTEIDYAKGISTARCARVSYFNHDGVRNVREDWDMYENKLKAYLHPSPFEHVATPCPHLSKIRELNNHPVKPFDDVEVRCRRWGNFYGWEQHRKELSNENRTDFKPNLPHLKQYPFVTIEEEIKRLDEQYPEGPICGDRKGF